MSTAHKATASLYPALLPALRAWVASHPAATPMSHHVTFRGDPSPVHTFNSQRDLAFGSPANGSSATGGVRSTVTPASSVVKHRDDHELRRRLGRLAARCTALEHKVVQMLGDWQGLAARVAASAAPAQVAVLDSVAGDLGANACGYMELLRAMQEGSRSLEGGDVTLGGNIDATRSTATVPRSHKLIPDVRFMLLGCSIRLPPPRLTPRWGAASGSDGGGGAFLLPSVQCSVMV